jgi:ABC-type multidrug transport system fused ATPase/permease subunit
MLFYLMLNLYSSWEKEQCMWLNVAELFGLSLLYGLALNSSVYWVVWLFAQLEQDMVCVERVQQYTDLSSEAPLVIEDRKPSQDWPQ